MNSKRVFYLLVASIVVLLGLAGAGVKLGSQMLQAKGDDLMKAKVTNATLSHKEAELEQAKKDIEKYTELELIATTIVPHQNDETLNTVLAREIVTLANQSGISIASIQFPASDLGETTKGRSSATKKTTNKALTGVTPREVTIQSDARTLASYNQMLSFLQKLEGNRRTANITNVTINPNDINRNRVSFTLTLTAYTKK